MAQSLDELRWKIEELENDAVYSTDYQQKLKVTQDLLTKANQVSNS